MSQVLTVPTHFDDIGELSEGFLDRVEQDTLILYGPVAYEEGSEIEFVVQLADGSPALEGTGRIRAAVDGGADRLPETRYDVVVEDLELDGRYEVVFERLVLARQAVSDAPPAEGDEPPTSDIEAPPADDEPVVEEAQLIYDDEPIVEEAEIDAGEVLSVAPDEVYSLAPEDAEPDTVPPEESAVDTVPPAASDEDDDSEDEDEPATVIAAVDAEAMMAEAEAMAEAVAESPRKEDASHPPRGEEPAVADEGDYDEVVVEATMSEAPEWDEESSLGETNDDGMMKDEGTLDSVYAFEHGIAAEPQVGMPVPMPSMAAPPEAPPAPPTLRLAEPPEGLTRPSVARAEESPFTTDGEVSDVHTTGLFAYEDGLPIPSRPPLPDPNGPQRAAPVEAVSDYDVEDSDPPEAHDDEYEEVRLSDFAEAAEEG
ncbi:MAG: hypothetical protein JSU89_00915 [Myxococcales bacterium]|nr:MAG: hypothetical protein JSU89_00915 [Myxococcales bacterium]